MKALKSLRLYLGNKAEGPWALTLPAWPMVTMPTGRVLNIAWLLSLILGQILLRRQTLAAALFPASWSSGPWSSCTVGRGGFPSCLVRYGFTWPQPLGKRVTRVQQKSEEHCLQHCSLAPGSTLISQECLGRVWVLGVPPQNSLEDCTFPLSSH